MKNSQAFKLWDIWLARVVFEDREKDYKIRPVLIVGEDSCVVLSVKITSHPPRIEYPGEYTIQRWREAGLLKPSTIRFSKRLTLPKSAFIKKLGVLQIEDQNKIEKMSERSF